jgi:hypothetical protein
MIIPYALLTFRDVITQAKKDIPWGKQSRVVLDVGCGVASFGGYLFDRDVLTMSFAPKDEHEAQVQFALERGIPAISAAMGTKRLPFPSRVFDVVHCARCRVPWHIEGDFWLKFTRNLFGQNTIPFCCCHVVLCMFVWQVANSCWNWTDCCVLVATLCGLLLWYTRSCLEMWRYGKVNSLRTLTFKLCHFTYSILICF